jgi:hypothetical protein
VALDHQTCVTGRRQGRGLSVLTFLLGPAKILGRPSSWGQTVVQDTRTGQFNCPNCDALYYLIKAEAGPETVDLELTCLVCNVPLPAREGPVVFKYFLSGSAPPRRKTRKT